jgi:hypothetical protein
MVTGKSNHPKEIVVASGLRHGDERGKKAGAKPQAREDGETQAKTKVSTIRRTQMAPEGPCFGAKGLDEIKALQCIPIREKEF